MLETARKILIVDDEENIRSSISSILNKKGFDVDEAANGEECFRKIKENRPHLIILDYKLNGENGLDVLKKLSDKWEDIAVIMLTGAGADNVKLAAESIKQGAYEYIPKPPDFAILPLLINKTIDLHQEKLERKRAEERHRIELEKANRRLEDIAVELKKEKGRIENVLKESQEQNKELEKAQKAKTEFLSNVSHELRTPLNAIIGFSDLLLDSTDSVLSGKQRRYVDNILSGGRKLLRLIDDLLDLSKVELSKAELNYMEFPPAQLIEDILKTAMDNAAKKEISIEARIDKGIGSIVMDEAKFKQIVFQLLDNAVKFTPAKGRVGIDAAIIKKDKLPKDAAISDSVMQMCGGNFIRFTVSDTGIGISEEDQERLFQCFEKIDSGYTREYEGTGLGLVLVKRLIDLLGGHIWVESRLGNGSRFSFVLPYYKEMTLDLSLERYINHARKNNIPLTLIITAIMNSGEIMASLGEKGYKKAAADIEKIFRNDLRFRKDEVFLYKDMKVIGILAGTDKTGGRSIAARINGFLKDRGVTEKNIKLSVRIGMASYPDDAITKEELIKTAEGRLSGEKEDAS